METVRNKLAAPGKRALLPFVASALNDIYSKIDGINNKFDNLQDAFEDFTKSIGAKFTLITQQLKITSKILNDIKNDETIIKSSTILKNTMEIIQDNIYYFELDQSLHNLLESLKALVLE